MFYPGPDGESLCEMVLPLPHRQIRYADNIVINYCSELTYRERRSVMMGALRLSNYDAKVYPMGHGQPVGLLTNWPDMPERTAGSEPTTRSENQNLVNGHGTQEGVLALLGLEVPHVLPRFEFEE